MSQFTSIAMAGLNASGLGQSFPRRTLAPRQDNGARRHKRRNPHTHQSYRNRIDPNQIWIVITFFPIDLYLLVKSFRSLFNPNQIQIVITLLGYIKYQSEFRLVLNLYSFIFHVKKNFRILFIQPKFRL